MADQTNYVAMSDEDFLKEMEANPPAIVDETTSSNEVSESTTENQTNGIEDTSNPATTTTTETETKPDETVTETGVSTENKDDKQSQESTTVTTTEETTNVPASDATPIDYKAFYESVTKEYKANGVVQPGIKDPEKFIQALQMATDYAQKTSAIKPVLRRAKLLDGISDEELTEMLEFKKGNPEVIKKALKQYNIDPVTLDLEQVNYTSHSVVPTETAADFEDTVKTLSQDKELFGRIDEVVFRQWDAKSKEKMLSDNGSMLNALATEIKSGRFDRIMPQVVQAKTFAPAFTLGKSDLDLYVELAEKEALTMQSTQTQTTNSQVAVNTQTQPPKAVDKELEDKRNQASISTTKQSNAKPNYDVTKLSDDEFMKLIDEGAFLNNK